jgi:hypothetical protein
MSSQQTRKMITVSKLLGFACVLLTVVLWAVTLTTDLTPGSIAAAGSLTAIVGIMIVFRLLE